MRTLITAVLVMWLLVGCSSPEAPEPNPTAKDSYLGFCPEVMHQIQRYHEGFDRLVATDATADFDQVRSAALRLAGISELAERRVTGMEAVEGDWLRNLGASALFFHESTTPGGTPEVAAQALNQIESAITRATSWCSEAAL